VIPPSIRFTVNVWVVRMGLLEAFGRAIDHSLKPEVVPPRAVRYYERYPGLGPLRWWDKLGPDEYLCRACGHRTRTWRGMQTHCRVLGHRRPAAS
jgi:hypothetical protein